MFSEGIGIGKCPRMVLAAHQLKTCLKVSGLQGLLAQGNRTVMAER